MGTNWQEPGAGAASEVGAGSGVPLGAAASVAPLSPPPSELSTTNAATTTTTTTIEVITAICWRRLVRWARRCC